ncbi:MAG: APC family permease [Gaiellaceae bacterium]
MAAREPEITLERRVVGLPTAIGTTFSLIVASSVLATMAGGFFASWVWLIALAIGFITMIFAAMSFSELATMIPKAGSMNEYVRAGLGPFFATVTVGVGYVAVQLFPGTAENFVSSLVTADVLGAPGDYKLWAVIYMGFIAVINLLGVRPFAAVEIMLTFIVAASLLVVGIVGLAGAGNTDPIGSALPDVDLTWSLLSALLGLAIFTFVGVEYTCPLAEELKRPSRDIPFGIFLGLLLIAIPVTLYGLAAARYLPPDVLGTLAPTLPVDVGIAIFGEAGKWWLGLIVIFASIGTLNAVVASVPRILYGMALTKQLPSPFAWLIPATRAPWVGIIVISAIPVVMNLFGAAEGAGFIKLILAGVLGWVTAYVLIHVTVVVLRRREPDATRPYRSPIMPIPQIVGAGLLGLAAYKIAPPGIEADSIYYRWLIFLLIAAAFSLVYNVYAYGSLGAIFRPVPLAEVRRETELIEEKLPPPVEPGGPHLPHDDER